MAAAIGSERVLRSASKARRPASPSRRAASPSPAQRAGAAGRSGGKAGSRGRSPAARASGSAGDVRAKQQVLLSLVAIITVASASLVRGDLYGGRTAAHVWWYGWVTALSTGVGALPMLFASAVSDWYLGVANALAAGMMSAASAALLHEGMELTDQVGGGALGGVALGVTFIAASQRLVDRFGDVKLSILEGVDMRKAVLIVVVMTLHSFSEGIGIGVSFGGGSPPQLGMLVTTTLAVHNVPEGFAVSVVLVSRGMSVLGACLWSIFTSAPQPIMALAAYAFVDSFAAVQAVGLGFAAGAMLWVAWVELFAEAYEACGMVVTALVGLAAAAAMGVCHAYLM